MRIIAGKHRGTKLNTSEGDNTRPTTDRIKTTMFNMIAFDIANENVLDVFSGSGALGFECLSRGASFVTFLDIDKNAYKIINENCEKLKEKEFSEILNIDYKDFFKNNNKQFGLIFLDPPYSLNIHKDALNLIKEKDALEDSGIIVVEISSDDDCGDLEKLGLEVYKKKEFSRTTLYFLKKRIISV